MRRRMLEVAAFAFAPALALAEFEEFDWQVMAPGGGQAAFDGEVLQVFGSCAFSATWVETVAPVGGVARVRYHAPGADGFPAGGPILVKNGAIQGLSGTSGETWFPVVQGDRFGFGVYTETCKSSPGKAEFSEFKFHASGPAVDHAGEVATEFGRAVAGLCDLDGDGVPEFAVGIPGADAAASNAGAVEIRSGVSGAAVLVDQGLGPDDRLGAALAPAGDVDGDGVGDWIEGAPEDPLFLVGGRDYARVRSFTAGILHVFHGGAQGDHLGAAVAGLPDLDGDGRAEIVVGVPGDDNGGLNAGAVRLYSGGTGQLLQVWTGPAPGSSLGLALAAAGDVDMDGQVEIVAGAPAAKTDGQTTGAALVLDPGGGVLLVVPGEKNSRQGAAVAGGFDTDGDGYADVAIGAPDLDVAGGNEGRVQVVSGADGASLYEVFSAAPGSMLGSALAIAGDVDADSVPDVLIGEPGGGGTASRVLVVSGATGEEIQILPGLAAADGFGLALAGFADLENNGAPEVLVGAPLGNPPRVLRVEAAVRWSRRGAGVPGGSGTPSIEGLGLLAPGTHGIVRVSGAAPGRRAWLIAGPALAEAKTPFGTLIPEPALVLPLSTDAAGALELAWTSLPALPGALVAWMQCWIDDPSAGLGVAATPGIRARVPVFAP